MQNKINDIGELLKTRLGSVEIEGKRNGWADMDRNIKRIKFFKFDPYEFNIYYASIIVLTFIFAAVTLTRHFMLYDMSSVDSNIAPVATGSATSSDTSNATNVIPFLIQKKNYKKNYFSSPQNADSIEVLHKTTSEDYIQSEEILEDSVPGFSAPEKTTESPVEKRTVYITKQDTIFIVDTLDKPDKRRKFKR